MGEPSPEDAGSYAYLMQFMDGNRIDLSFHAPEKWKFVTGDSQSIVLLDKDNASANFPQPVMLTTGLGNPQTNSFRIAATSSGG